MTEMTYDRQYEPIVIGKPLMDLLLKQNNSTHLLGLYCFYYYTAKWQETNQVRATIPYVAKGLNWGIDKVRKYKKRLIELKLIEEIQERDNKSQFMKSYIKIKFIWTEEKTRPMQNPHPGKTRTPAKPKANALSNNNRNALSNNIESISSKEEIHPSGCSQHFSNSCSINTPCSGKDTCLDNPSKDNVEENNHIEQSNSNNKSCLYNRLKVSPTVEGIIDHWNKHGSPFTKHKKGNSSKTYCNIAKLLESRLKSGSKEELTDAIDLYQTAIVDCNYSLSPKQCGFAKSLSAFLRIDQYTKQIIKKYNPSLDIKSWCDEALKGKEYFAEKYAIKDRHPKVTKRMKEVWSDYLEEFINPNTGRTREKEMNNYGIEQASLFRKVSDRFHKFCEKVTDKEKWNLVGELRYSEADPSSLVPMIWKYLEDKDDPTFQFYYFNRDDFWDRTFPEYLIDYGYIYP